MKDDKEPSLCEEKDWTGEESRQKGILVSLEQKTADM